MKLKSVEIENYRAIEKLRLPLHPKLTVLHGANTCGKTSVLSAIAVGLGVIPELLPGCSGIDFLETDLREGCTARAGRLDDYERPNHLETSEVHGYGGPASGRGEDTVSRRRSIAQRTEGRRQPRLSRHAAHRCVLRHRSSRTRRVGARRGEPSSPVTRPRRFRRRCGAAVFGPTIPLATPR